MKPKMIGKIAVDLAMTVLLLLLMAKQLTGDVAHEWLGAGMFVFWIAHHALNFGWHRSLFRGKYTPVRAMQTVVNLLLLAAMLGTMVSAIILSRAVFAFLRKNGYECYESQAAAWYFFNINDSETYKEIAGNHFRFNWKTVMRVDRNV